MKAYPLDGKSAEKAYISIQAIHFNKYGIQ